MVARQHLDNAPITEAIIDFRVKLSPDVTIDQLKDITQKLPEEYSEIEPRNQIITVLKFEKDAEPSVSAPTGGPVGFWCTTSDGLNIAQIRLNGFTFSALKPYTTWEEFSEKARYIWELYREGVGCDAISRLALRYINHLELPMKIGEEYSKYLTSAPDVPEPLPQGISNFMNRVTIVAPEKGVSAHVTQAMGRPEKQVLFSVILDIDAFKESGETIPLDEVWDVFSILRDFKNDIFFEYITPETLETLK